MEEVVVGVVPAPELPATIARKLSLSLEKKLTEYIDDEVCWKVEIEIDSLTGAAEKVKEIMDEAKKLKEKNDWNYVICLTDLPIFNGKFIVLADADVEAKIAQISLPAFGTLPTPKRVRKTLVHMVKELYFRHINTDDNIQLLQKGIGFREHKQQNGFFGKLKEAFYFSTIQRQEFSKKFDGVSVRFMVVPKWNGLMKILSGMTVANRPWAIMPSFKGVTGVAFATGAYMLIFTTLWQLSALYGLDRFVGLMLAAMFGMVSWIIFAHDLWEKAGGNNSKRLRLLYNATTVLTLSTSVIVFYVSLFMLFLIAVSVFVPPDIFQETIGHQVGLFDYVKLAWLATSAATAAGAIGAGLEKAETVRTSTYSYRQYIRSEKIRKQREKEQAEEQGEKK